MYRARSLASAIVATVITAAALAGVVWFSAVLAARGTSQAILPTLLTTNNFAGLEWPFRTDTPPTSVHVTFYVAVALVAIIAGVVTLLTTRKASPRNGASALLGTWFGVLLGSVVAAVAVYFIRVGALAPTEAARNGVLAELVRSFAFGGLLLGLVPAVLSWATFKIANRSRAAEYAAAMDLAEGRGEDENPFDLAPGSNGDVRPVEPGFTYPAGDVYDDAPYRDADLPPSERRTPSMTFTDVTDATGEDSAERDAAAQTPEPTHDQEPVDVSFGAPSEHDATGATPDSTDTVIETSDDATSNTNDFGERAADYGYAGDTKASDNEPVLRQTGT
ncbi:MAG: hypothetical protein ACK5MR_12055 [Cumulibacter sp.]